MYINNKFKIQGFTPAGDQPRAIEQLVASVNAGNQKTTLLGATGTGKTFTIANVIQQTQKPTLVIAHNKTLAAQLAQEFRQFFPDAAVHYFVSYYDYYQPEAYMPATDTYIEKDASINEEIDRLRHASTQALLTRSDVIICASVSCIYGLGSPKEYEKVNIRLQVGDTVSKVELMQKFIAIYYERTNADLSPGTFRAVGNRIDIMPISETNMIEIEFAAGKISRLALTDPVSMSIIKLVDDYFIFPAKHFISDELTRERAVEEIKHELSERLKEFDIDKKILEADRLKRRTTYDVAMIKEVGFCQGIENYSRILSGKMPGQAPETLMSYFPHDENGKPEFLTVIDESHVTLPQLNAMYAGDQSRKQTLVDFGFRLPSAKDNRPLKYVEFEERAGQTIYVSATPSKIEKETSAIIVEQIIRPTGLIDPVLEVRPVREINTTPTPSPFPKGRGEKSPIIKYNKNLLEAAKENRKKMTESEKSFWEILKGDKTGFDFTRQKVVGNFIADFYCNKLMLAIEIDGSSHDNKKEHDKEREDYFLSQNIKTIRFKNEEVGNLNIEALKNIFNNRMVEVEASLGEAPRSGEGVKYPGQVYDFINECEKDVKKGGRAIATTLTKKMAESLSEFLIEKGLKAKYLHSDIKTMERIEILTDFRKGIFDVLVGVNLLREGLDLPEVTLIGILDADKEGFLRSETSLIQTIGRAARNVDGRVILYADKMTGSMERAMAETERRRTIQEAYNAEHGITPKTIIKNINDIGESVKGSRNKAIHDELEKDKKLFAKNPTKLITLKEKQMKEAVKTLDFETAAILRDELRVLRARGGDGE